MNCIFIACYDQFIISIFPRIVVLWYYLMILFHDLAVMSILYCAPCDFVTRGGLEYPLSSNKHPKWTLSHICPHQLLLQLLPGTWGSMTASPACQGWDWVATWSSWDNLPWLIVCDGLGLWGTPVLASFSVEHPTLGHPTCLGVQVWYGQSLVSGDWLELCGPVLAAVSVQPRSISW